MPYETRFEQRIRLGSGVGRLDPGAVPFAGARNPELLAALAASDIGLQAPVQIVPSPLQSADEITEILNERAIARMREQQDELEERAAELEQGGFGVVPPDEVTTPGVSIVGAARGRVLASNPALQILLNPTAIAEDELDVLARFRASEQRCCPCKRRRR